MCQDICKNSGVKKLFKVQKKRIKNLLHVIKLKKYTFTTHN